MDTHGRTMGGIGSSSKYMIFKDIYLKWIVERMCEYIKEKYWDIIHKNLGSIYIG